MPPPPRPPHTARPGAPPATHRLPPQAGGPQPDLPPWRPTTGRQRLGLVLLTLATVAGLAYVLQRPHQLLVGHQAAREAAACQVAPASRPVHCPGATMPITLVPPAAAASR